MMKTSQDNSSATVQNAEMVGKDELWYGKFGRMVVVPAKAPFRTSSSFALFDSGDYFGLGFLQGGWPLKHEQWDAHLAVSFEGGPQIGQGICF
ncbi:hypothetical protein F2Q69_00023057 [Brassica cretica]|uniref:Uncharacterized protein n=1 Tax=Brassica cretica TaxID=69181 RepID=A0A8S9QTJ9_BRACR|nr:hypothetical protein F2Q69_00023057 [Brassica cretica]